MAQRRFLGIGDARAESQSMTRGLPGEEGGHFHPRTAWAKPGMGSHKWFRIKNLMGTGSFVRTDRQSQIPGPCPARGGHWADLKARGVVEGF